MEGCWRRLKESRWKVLGGSLALLFVLAAGAAAQQHQWDDTRAAIGVPASPEVVVASESPEGGESSRDATNDSLKTGHRDDLTGAVSEDVPHSIPVRSSPIASAVTGDGLVDSSNSVVLHDQTDDSNREPNLESLAVETVDNLETRPDNPFFIADEEAVSGTVNEAATPDAIQAGASQLSQNTVDRESEVESPSAATVPQVPDDVLVTAGEAGTTLVAAEPQVPKDALNAADAAEQIGIPLDDMLGKVVQQPAPSDDAMKTTDQGGPPLSVTGADGKEGVVVEVSEQDQGGIPKDLASAQLSLASVLEDTSSPDTESPKEEPPVADLGSMEAQALLETSPDALAPAEETTVVPVLSGTPDADTVQEEVQTVDPAPAAEAETIEPEALDSAPEIPRLQDTEDNVALRESQVSDVASPESQTSDDTDSGAPADPVEEVSVAAVVAQTQVSQVLPTSPDAEVELVMAGLAAAAPSAAPSRPPKTGASRSANPPATLVSEIEPGPEEEVDIPLEAVSLATEQTVSDDVLLVENEVGVPPQAEENVNAAAPSAQEVELLKVPEEVAAAATPDTEATAAQVSAMNAEDLALLPGMIADDDMTGEVIDESVSVADPAIPASSIEALETFFVADDPQATRVEDEALGKDVTEVAQQLPEDEVQISALQDIVPFSPATVEVPLGLEEAVEDVLQAEIEAAMEDFGVKVPESDQVVTVDAKAPGPALVTDPAPVPADEPEPVLDTAPPRVPETAPVLEQEVAPVSVMAPAPPPDPVAAAAPVLEAAPAPAPEAAPAPAPEAAPILEAAPAPAPEREPILEAAQAPAPEAEPILEAAPAPAPEAEPILEAAPDTDKHVRRPSTSATA
ncbi:uncharacterized protein [Panulirus ornatus]|uniref:uncharacterized protein n=1 Tax=Panulirus ornatus TaxID=150431 RepID=UPI003A875002